MLTVFEDIPTNREASVWCTRAYCHFIILFALPGYHDRKSLGRRKCSIWSSYWSQSRCCLLLVSSRSCHLYALWWYKGYVSYRLGKYKRFSYHTSVLTLGRSIRSSFTSSCCFLLSSYTRLPQSLALVIRCGNCSLKPQHYIQLLGMLRGSI